MNRMREDIINEFLAALEQETIPWRKEWMELGGRPCNAVTGNHYRGINVLWLMYMQEKMGYEDNRWCTFKQAQEQGWQIRKGEKGTRVEFWSWYDTEKKKRLDWKDAENLKNELGPMGFEKRVKPMARVSVVFNGKQIEGIPEQTITHNILDEETLAAQRAVLLNNMALQLYEGDVSAYYQLSTDSIHMPNINRFENEYSYMATFLHEAGHATGHSSRLNRDMKGSFGSPEYAREELRAEIASAFTAQTLGLPGADTSFDNHKAYIRNWIAVLKKEPNELFRAINDAEKISDYLIEKGEFKKILEKEREVDVAAYAEQGFSNYQMEEIRKGLEAGLDVSIYANPKFTADQMNQIRKGLITGVDVGIYAHPQYSSHQMREIRMGLGDELDTSVYMDPKFTADQMDQIRRGLQMGVDITVYADPKFGFLQMLVIRKGLEAGLDVSSYLNPDLNALQMDEIRKELEREQNTVLKQTDKIDHNLLDEVARMELDLRVPAEERLARWSGDYSTFEPVREGLTNQELQEHLETLRQKQIPSQEEIYQSMPDEKKQLYDMNMDYGDWEAVERLVEEQRRRLQEEESRKQQRQERSVVTHGKIR